jgi:hypothetical protein
MRPIIEKFQVQQRALESRAGTAFAAINALQRITNTIDMVDGLY